MRDADVESAYAFLWRIADLISSYASTDQDFAAEKLIEARDAAVARAAARRERERCAALVANLPIPMSIVRHNSDMHNGYQFGVFAAVTAIRSLPDPELAK